jgi:hypothetical protein
LRFFIIFAVTFHDFFYDVLRFFAVLSALAAGKSIKEQFLGMNFAFFVDIV